MEIESILHRNQPVPLRASCTYPVCHDIVLCVAHALDVLTLSHCTTSVHVPIRPCFIGVDAIKAPYRKSRTYLSMGGCPLRALEISSASRALNGQEADLNNHAELSQLLRMQFIHLTTEQSILPI